MNLARLTMCALLLVACSESHSPPCLSDGGVPFTSDAETQDAGSVIDGPAPVCDLSAGVYRLRCSNGGFATCASPDTHWYFRAEVDGMPWGCGLTPRADLSCTPSGELAECPEGFVPSCVLGAQVTAPDGELVWCEPPDWY